MRRLQLWVLFLYPPQWRARYAAELEALLEQMKPAPKDLIDLLWGAIRMHIKEWSYLKFAAAFSVVGLIAGTMLQLAIPDRYQSRVSVSVPSEREWVKAQQSLRGRKLLKTIIEEQNLYPAERLREPLEDVIDTMRGRDLKFRNTSASAREIVFGYTDRALAQSTAQALLSRVESDPAFHTMGNAGEAERISPNRLRLFVMCLGAALLIGLATSKAMRFPGRIILTIVIYSAIGGALLGAGSYLIPERYISTAMLISADGKSLQAGHVGGKFGKGLTTRSGNTDGGTPFLDIDYIANDPREAQATVEKVVNLELQTRADRAGAVEVVQPASLSFSPVGPNHLVFVEIGLLLGLVAGALKTRVIKFS